MTQNIVSPELPHPSSVGQIMDQWSRTHILYISNIRINCCFQVVGVCIIVRGHILYTRKNPPYTVLCCGPRLQCWPPQDGTPDFSDNFRVLIAYCRGMCRYSFLAREGIPPVLPTYLPTYIPTYLPIPRQCPLHVTLPKHRIYLTVVLNRQPEPDCLRWQHTRKAHNPDHSLPKPFLCYHAISHIYICLYSIY